jgi:hypothetical protein
VPLSSTVGFDIRLLGRGALIAEYEEGDRDQ